MIQGSVVPGHFYREVCFSELVNKAGFLAHWLDWNCSSVVVYLFHLEQKLGLCQDAVLQPCNDMASPTSLFQPFWTK